MEPKTVARIKKRPVKVKFLDHSLYSGDEAKIIECEVYGLLFYEDDVCIKVASWICNDILNDADSEVFSLVKHPGMQIFDLTCADDSPEEPRRIRKQSRLKSRRRVPSTR